MKIVIIDGQGGKIGKSIIESIKIKNINANIYALGTNALATNTMLKAGADFAATGENAIIVNSKNADIIVGPIGIAIVDSLLGEITPKIAKCVGQSSAEKVLLPLNRCGLHIVGADNCQTSQLISKAVEQIVSIVETFSL